MVKIFLVYHKPSPLLDSAPFVPIQVGSGPDVPGIVCRDNVGDNIAAKNPNFCELTAQYWIWKNVNAEYVGLMHYRRLISFTCCADDRFTDFSPKTLARFGWTEKRISGLLKTYDILMPPDWTCFPPGEPGHVMTPYEFHCREHRKGDIDVTLEIIRDLTPEYAPYAQKALCEDTHECFGNICVMRKDLFDAYCEWLFKVLFELERRIEIPVNREEARLFGFLSERLIMVFLAYAREKFGARIWHSPSMPFGDFGENIHSALAVRPHAAVENPKVSVIIPVYNTAPYLPHCLNSVCGQCLDEVEIICVDDGSTDGSREILAAAAEKDRRIRIIHGDHRGPGAARNRGLDVSRGRYLAFVDSDDWVDRFIWFRSVRRADAENLDLVLFDVEKVDDATGVHTPDIFARLVFRPGGPRYPGIFEPAERLPNVFCSCCYPVNRLVRRSLWGDLRFPEDVTIGEDSLPHIVVALSAKRAGAFEQPFYFYRQRAGSSMRSRGRQALDHLRDIDAVMAYLKRTERLAATSHLWPHFVLRMIENTFVFWPARPCHAEIRAWWKRHRPTFAATRCHSLTVLGKVLDTGSYGLFVVVFRSLRAYRGLRYRQWIACRGLKLRIRKFLGR